MPRLTRLLLAAMVGAGLALTASAVTQANEVAPRLEAPMQPLNVGQDRHSAFPGMARLADGSLRLVWREGSDHVASRDGVIKIAESQDDGATWHNPQTLRMFPDYRDPQIASIDGIEYLTWFGANQMNEAWGAGVMRAWGVGGQRIDTAQYGAISAPIVKLPDGRFGATYYAKNPGEAQYTAWMAWSYDTWTWTSNRIINMLGSNTPATEPYLVVNGGVTHMLFRWGNDQIGIRSSTNSGASGSWDAPRMILTQATGRPSVIATANGTLVVVYRDLPGRNARMAYSVDNGVSWQDGGIVLAAPVGGIGMTYAAMVETSPGTIRLVVGMEQPDGTSDLWGGTVTLP